MAILFNLVSLNPPVHWFTWKVTLKANGSDFLKNACKTFYRYNYIVLITLHIEHVS